MTFGKWHELSDVLTDIEWLWTEGGRTRLVVELRRNDIRLDVPVSGTTDNFVVALLSACADQRDALHLLADALDWEENGSETARLVRRNIERLLPSQWFWSLSERHAYLALLTKILSIEKLPWYYLQATGADSPGELADADDLLRAVELLPQRGSGGPLLTLAELVERFPSKRKLSRKAAKWSDTLAERMGATAELARLRRLPRTQATPPPPALMIQLSMRGDQHDRYHLTAWLFDDHAEQLHATRDPITLDRLDEAVRALLPQALTRVIARGATTFTVEFILPRVLLGHAVEDCVIDPIARHRTLRVEHPVVVRDLERQSDATAFLRWRRKWTALLDGEPGRSFGIDWVDGDIAVTEQERFYRTMLGDDKLAIGLCGVRNGGAGLSLALDAGLPVIIWRRSGREPEERVQAELAREHPRGLAETVLHVRREADKPDDDGSDMVLLLDDPDRRPVQDFKLAAPTPPKGAA